MLQKFLTQKNIRGKCNHGRSITNVSFDTIETFVNKMNENVDDLPYFLFNFFVELTHDDFALPEYFDVQFKNMLLRFEEKKYLDNTLLVILSDHGNRLVPYSYKTDTGRMERKLPFLSLRLPKKLWNTKYQLNAKNNKNKLIAAYDIHQTLRHFLQCKLYKRVG
jgi:hypothetical protein